MFNTIDYIGNIVKNLTFTQPITNISPGSGETTIEVCKTYWAFPKGRITIDGQERIIIDVEVNESITIKGDLIGSETEYLIKAPNFFHGTPLQTANALVMVKDWKKKLPMVYFIEPYDQTIYPEPINKIYNESKFKILFLLPGDLSQSVLTQYETAITPANNLVFEWEKAILTDPKIAEIQSYNKSNRVNYGVWIRTDRKPKPSLKDNIKLLIDEDVSGVEIDIRIPFKRTVCDVDALCKSH